MKDQLKNMFYGILFKKLKQNKSKSRSERSGAAHEIDIKKIYFLIAFTVFTDPSFISIRKTYIPV